MPESQVGIFFSSIGGTIAGSAPGLEYRTHILKEVKTVNA